MHSIHVQKQTKPNYFLLFLSGNLYILRYKAWYNIIQRQDLTAIEQMCHQRSYFINNNKYLCCKSNFFCSTE